MLKEYEQRSEGGNEENIPGRINGWNMNYPKVLVTCYTPARRIEQTKNKKEG